MLDVHFVSVVGHNENIFGQVDLRVLARHGVEYNNNVNIDCIVLMYIIYSVYHNESHMYWGLTISVYQ